MNHWVILGAPLVVVGALAGSLTWVPAPAPLTGEERTEIAVAHFKLGNLALARPLLEQRLSEDPADYRAQYGAGLLAFNENRLPAAIQDLEAAHRLKPDNRDISLSLGAAYQRANRTADATALYEALAKDDKNNPNLVFNQASLAVAQHEYAKAKSLYEEYLRLVPKAYNRKGIELRLKKLEARLKAKDSK